MGQEYVGSVRVMHTRPLKTKCRLRQEDKIRIDADKDEKIPSKSLILGGVVERKTP